MSNKNLRVAVIGAGGIGGIIASLLARENADISIITSKKSANLINQGGLTVRSEFFGDFTSFPKAKVTLDHAVDCVFFATKYPYLTKSFSRLKKTALGKPIFISLLNGLGSRELIIKTFGKNFITGMIGSIEVYRDENGIIQQPNFQQPELSLAQEDGVSAIELQNICDLIETTGIKIIQYKNYQEVIWRKLVRLGAISSVTAAFQKSIGEIINSDFERNILMGLIEEGSEIANACGVNVNSQSVKEEVLQLPFGLKTSLSRDIIQDKESELESITIAILNEAKKRSVSVPHYESILMIIKNE